MDATCYRYRQRQCLFCGECNQNQFRHITVQSPILLEAIDVVSKHPLRAYDAIQLSAALYLQRVRVPMSLSRLTFLSADKVLNQAALAEGLLVDDSNDHT